MLNQLVGASILHIGIFRSSKHTSNQNFDKAWKRTYDPRNAPESVRRSANARKRNVNASERRNGNASANVSARKNANASKKWSANLRRRSANAN